MGTWINATLTTSSAAVVDKVTSLAVPKTRKYLIVHNPSKTNYVCFTLDGTTPVIGSNGITLFPGGTSTSDQFTFNGSMLGISDGTSSLTVYSR
jgi:hypothetical protein